MCVYILCAASCGSLTACICLEKCLINACAMQMNNYCNDNCKQMLKLSALSVCGKTKRNQQFIILIIIKNRL